MTYQVSGRQTSEVVSWFHGDPLRSNPYCLYGGEPVGLADAVPSDKEHLIAREFVPTGTLFNGFNFLFRACRECNARKADADRHISSVTLLTGPARRDDPRIDALARRKATKDYHPAKPGVLVGNASEELKMKGSWGGLSVGATFVAPPQPYDEALRLLACNHIQAIFSLCTTEDFRDPVKTKLLPATQWRFFDSFPRNDWGNVQLQEICSRVRGLPLVARIESADGFFKAVVRAPSDGPWFWGLEWNKSLRVVGAIANERDAISFFEGLPEHKWAALSDMIRSRREIPEADGTETLFSP